MIEDLQLDPTVWYDWAEHVLQNKHDYIMPAKLSLHYNSSYFNTMPSILPKDGIMGCKVVNRYIDRVPALESQLLLYNYNTGKNLALMDGSYITAMRTGASAVHAIETFANPDFYEVGFMGLGNIGNATLEVFFAHYKNKKIKMKLLRYKNHSDIAIERYKKYDNVEFVVVESIRDIIINSDVVISCITYTDDILSDPSWYKPGCLLLPIHLRGFQNCDIVFDKIYGDEYEQIKGFRYFSEYKFFAETSEVLRGEKEGRTNHDERIIIYYMGMSIHDIYAASQIFNYFKEEKDIQELGPRTKTWL